MKGNECFETLDDLISQKAEKEVELERIQDRNQKEKRNVRITRITSSAKLLGILAICPAVLTGFSCVIGFSPFKRDERKIKASNVFEIDEKGLQTESVEFDQDYSSYVYYYDAWKPTDNGNYSRTVYKYSVDSSQINLDNIILLSKDNNKITTERLKEILKNAIYSTSESEEIKPSLTDEEKEMQGHIGAVIKEKDLENIKSVPESAASNGLTIGIIAFISILVDVIIFAYSYDECCGVDELIDDIFDTPDYLDEQDVKRAIAILEKKIGEYKLLELERQFDNIENQSTEKQEPQKMLRMQ